jgi:hypothetical protein
MIGHIGSAVVAELDALLQRGLVADIFRMERAYSLLDEIGSNAVRINDKANGNFAELFGAFQSSLITDCVLSTARLFDKPNARYPTRCIRHVLAFISEKASELPEIREPFQLGLTLRAASLDISLGAHIANGSSDFAMALAGYYTAVLEDDSTTNTIEALKRLRDKAIAHNEHVDAVVGPTWVGMRQLVAHAKHFVGILGWAWTGTVYDMNGEFTLTDDATRPSRALGRLLERISTRE